MFDECEEPEEPEAGAPAWVVTFGDMMSLLLAFFVLLLSFSTVDQMAFASIMGSLKEAFGTQKIIIETNPLTGKDVKPVHLEGNASGLELLDRLNSIMPGAFAGGHSGQGGGDGSSRVSVTVPGRLLYPSGDAQMTGAFKKQLVDIAELMKEDPELTLKVFGHTDDRPISTTRFHNNWELSAARAASVIIFMIEQGGIEARRLVATGYADSRPIVPNDSDENREKNRRVEFLFIEGGDDSLDMPGQEKN